jgi:hypothetical protein
MQKVPNITDLRCIGEAIPNDLGAKMVKDFQDSNPRELIGHYIGRNILDQILNQPGCVGIRFYNAINEVGKKTLVYVGIDENNSLITQYTYVSSTGQLIKEKGIVADRSGDPTDSEKQWDWFA